MEDSGMLREMLAMKISNWESIEYSEGICCPNPECDNDGYYDDARNILGCVKLLLVLCMSVNVTNASPNTDSTELLAVTNSTSINSQVVSC